MGADQTLHSAGVGERIKKQVKKRPASSQPRIDSMLRQGPLSAAGSTSGAVSQATQAVAQVVFEYHAQYT